MDIQNHYYGHSAALARYAGLTSIRHIDGLVQHGWTVASPTLVHFADFARLRSSARRFVWSHTSRGWSPREDPFPTTAIGAPYLYLRECLGDHLASSDISPDAQAVAFPVHDTRLVKLSKDEDAFARQLEEAEGPSIVCLHPEDLDDPEKLRAWTCYGHTVVSAGSRRDPEFLGRVLGLIRSARRVVSNLLSTAVVYAAAEGTDTAVYGPEVSVGALGSSVSIRTRELWPEFHETASRDARKQIALAELGSSHLLDPADLREVLGWNRHSTGPFLSYWMGAPVRKAGTVLGLIERPQGALDAGSGTSPWTFLRHPLSHLPGRLPRLPRYDASPPPPLIPRSHT